jgi:hypothetical protein
LMSKFMHFSIPGPYLPSAIASSCVLRIISAYPRLESEYAFVQLTC